ncbi:MAG: DHA2 family efflux MFS transporter permease subunit [Spirochaetia bacterium]|jgi:EmrB/QacA subfamily drug resistance transporter|nr:DHA2 family efflux MFS transporter permease subunit [Spirochaetia bacterium]
MDSPYERRIDTRLVLSIVATGLLSFMGVVIETAMNVTFPTLMKEFDITTATVQWVTTAYLLMLANVIPASSFLKKRFKTRNLFIAAMLLFIIGTVIDAIAPTFALLVAGRLIQGIGTGIALPLMFNIVLEQAPLDKMGMMMGIATLICAMAPAIGPSVGGMIINTFGWRMIFAILLPFQILAFFLGFFSIRSAATEKTSFDWFGYLCLVIGFTSFIYAIDQIETAGLSSIQVIGPFGTSIIGFILFRKHSKETKRPIVHLHIFHNHIFTLSVLVIVFGQFICLALGFLIPNYAQIVLGENPFTAGCLLLPGCMLGAILAPFSGKILDRMGAKKPIIIGNLAMVMATLCYSIFAWELTTDLFIIFYVCFTFGQGFLMGNTMTNGLRQISDTLQADGNAIINTLQQLAGAVGTAITAAIVAAAQQGSTSNLIVTTAKGSAEAFYLLFILACTGLLCSSAIFSKAKKSHDTPIKNTART